jgi:hypothetical protein
MGGEPKTYGMYELEEVAIQAVIQCIKARMGYITIVVRSSQVREG